MTFWRKQKPTPRNSSSFPAFKPSSPAPQASLCSHHLVQWKRHPLFTMEPPLGSRSLPLARPGSPTSLSCGSFLQHSKGPKSPQFKIRECQAAHWPQSAVSSLPPDPRKGESVLYSLFVLHSHFCSQLDTCQGCSSQTAPAKTSVLSLGHSLQWTLPLHPRWLTSAANCMDHSLTLTCVLTAHQTQIPSVPNRALLFSPSLLPLWWPPYSREQHLCSLVP